MKKVNIKNLDLDKLKELFPGNWKQNEDFFWLEAENYEIYYTTQPSSRIVFGKKYFVWVLRDKGISYSEPASFLDIKEFYRKYFKLAAFS